MRNSVILTTILVLLTCCPAGAQQVNMGALSPETGVLSGRIQILHVSEPALSQPLPLLESHTFSAPYVPPASLQENAWQYYALGPADLVLDETEEEAQEDRARDFIRESARHMLGNTSLGQKAGEMADEFSSWFRLGFSKDALSDRTDWLLPGRARTEDPADSEYGISFSTRFRLNTDDVVDDIVLRLNTNYGETNADLSYELMEERLRLNLFDTGLNRLFGADIRMELSADEDDVANALMINKPF